MPGPVFLGGGDVALRTVEEEDIGFLQRGFTDRRIGPYVARYRPISRSQQRTEYEEQFVGSDDSIDLLVCANEEPVGYAHLFAIDHRRGTSELGYWIVPDEQGKGYGTAAVRLITDYGFEEVNLHKLTARVHESNKVSQRLLERVGFVEEGVQREQRFLDGEYQDSHLYGLLAQEWRDR
ncbi:GNAT family N-acetyltransferase [Halobacteriales archaeon QS_3_64_16]|nr:MAG: GNAT family N-acetyltransferase [Halobacteriales archaeon QS_3_64_16]